MTRLSVYLSFGDRSENWKNKGNWNYSLTMYNIEIHEISFTVTTELDTN